MVLPAGLVAEKAAATAFANVVMGRLNSELEKKYQMWRNIERESTSLQTDLGILAAAVDDYQTMAAHPPRTAVARVYGEEISELTHDIEDCIERFLHRVTCKAGASRARRSAHAIRTFRIRLRFAAKMKEFRNRVATARERALNASLLLADGVQAQPTYNETAQQVSYAQDPVGIADATRELLALLGIEPNEDEVEGTSTTGAAAQLRVVAVVGFGGSGKTTLAKAVYDIVQKEGALRCVWVDGHLLDYKGANGVVKHIQDEISLGQVSSATSPTEYHEDSRYLIVIDDIKEKHLMHWNTVRNAFRDNGRIIVTTATQSVANRCCNYPREEDRCTFGYVYSMKTLGEEDSRKIALMGRCSPDLVLGAAKLLKKCGGLPLALCSVACELSCEKVLTGKLCNKLCNDMGTYLEREDKPNFARLRGVLRENYTSLPDYTVRACLLYLGIFPMDHPLRKNVITRRWLAEGYARHHEGLHQILADETFKTFINRNIILPVVPISSNTEKTWKAHGIMHAFMLHKSMSKKFIMPFGSQHKKVRHFFIHDSNGGSSRTMPDIDLSRVRSLTVIGNAGGAISNFEKYKLTRVLDLEGCIDVKDYHLKDICNLWNLRYLSLGSNITRIPKEIAQLKLLETLDVSKTRVNVLPVEAIGLPCLIHLIGKFKLQDQVKTERLPKECMLETVKGFVADKGQGLLLLMDYMKRLNKVKIWCDSEKTEQGQVDMNNHLSKAIQRYIETPMGEDNVRSLSLYFQGLPQGTLSALDQVCQHYSLRAPHMYHLSSLKLHGNSNSATLPKFVALFRDLTKLSISTTLSVTQHLLSVLGRMSVLLYLKITANSIDDGFIIQVGMFRSLHRLSLVLKVVGTTVLTIEDGAWPEIISLQIICKDLVGLSGVEIMSLRELKEITLHPDVDEETRNVWEAVARNHHNRPNVLAIAGDLEETPTAVEKEPPATRCAMSAEVEAESNATAPIKSGHVVSFAKEALVLGAEQLQEVAPSATC
ncbi:disease resistance protein RGA4-like isoform X1 [Lolium rigidum]|uniref:disease resistance protein RGA4-like isoform X1 n=1 Tax=Lolium rigidum TaxID=89674 RepID=UPI001F5C5F69|nr:disease resistance protein RGA4-like isoform X1 [Lolium rigidum]